MVNVSQECRTESAIKHLRRADAGQKKRRASPTLVQELAMYVLGKNDCLSFDQLLSGAKSAMLSRGLSRVGAKSLSAEVIAKHPFKMNPDQTVSAK